MASLRYRCLESNPKTVEYPVAASQYFYHEGESLVNLDSSGHITKLETADTTVFGMAIVPKGMGAGSDSDYWLSSATAGKDKMMVILAESGYEFLMPGIITATAAMIGGAWDIIAANDNAGTIAQGANTTHHIDLDTSSTDIVIATKLGTVVDGGLATDIVVKINPLKIQAD